MLLKKKLITQLNSRSQFVIIENVRSPNSGYFDEYEPILTSTNS